MRPEEELIKKKSAERKKKRRSRLIRFIVFLVFGITVISLIFYSLDNPDFISDVKNRLAYFYSPDSAAEEGQESAENTDIGQTDESTTVSETTQYIETPETQIQQDSGGSNGFWARILNFFKRNIDDGSEKFPASLEIKFYFASLGQEKKFVYEKRTIHAGSPTIAVENAVRGLLDGPAKSFNYPVIPPGTKLLDVEIYENLAKIDLSKEFLDNSLESGILDEYVVYTIVDTVTQIPGVEGVVFLVDSKRIKVYGTVDLSIPAIMDEKYIDQEKQ